MQNSPQPGKKGWGKQCTSNTRRRLWACGSRTPRWRPRLAALRGQNAELAKGAEKLEAENTALAGENRALQKQSAALETRLAALEGQNRALAEQAAQAGRFAVQWENFLRYDGTPQPEDFSLAAGQAPGWGIGKPAGPLGRAAGPPPPAPASECNGGPAMGLLRPSRSSAGHIPTLQTVRRVLSGGRSAGGPESERGGLQTNGPTGETSGPESERGGLQTNGPTGETGGPESETRWPAKPTGTLPE